MIDASETAATWEIKYADSSWIDMLQEAERINMYLERQAADEMQRMRIAGEYEMVSTNGSISFDSKKGDWFCPGLEKLVHTYDGEVQHYQVSRERFPDLWLLGGKAHWLQVHGDFRKRNPGSKYHPKHTG